MLRSGGLGIPEPARLAPGAASNHEGVDSWFAMAGCWPNATVLRAASLSPARRATLPSGCTRTRSKCGSTRPCSTVTSARAPRPTPSRTAPARIGGRHICHCHLLYSRPLHPPSSPQLRVGVATTSMNKSPLLPVSADIPHEACVCTRVDFLDEPGMCGVEPHVKSDRAWDAHAPLTRMLLFVLDRCAHGPAAPGSRRTTGTRWNGRGSRGGAPAYSTWPATSRPLASTTVPLAPSSLPRPPPTRPGGQAVRHGLPHCALPLAGL